MTRARSLFPVVGATLFIASCLLPMSHARAELVLSQLVVELHPSAKLREDIEVWNSAPERAYVAVEPSEILNPGLPGERRTEQPDPESRGLLVAPARMILEPGQRKLIRVAAIGANTNRERVYRVTVKPVAGELASEKSGLKILVGYDLLVLIRPNDSLPNLIASRMGDMLNFRNAGNASVELIDGRQCQADGKNCVQLPGKRLYSGTLWSVRLGSGLAAEYTVISDGRSVRQRF